MIQRKEIGAVRFFDGERSLQSKIAGLTWSQSYSIGDAFYKARSALPMPVRGRRSSAMSSDPYDGAVARARWRSALARLKRGELLSPASTARLLSTWARPGPANRLRAALKPGWRGATRPAPARCWAADRRDQRHRPADRARRDSLCAGVIFTRPQAVRAGAGH